MQNLKTAIIDLFVNLNANDHMILMNLKSRGSPITRRKLRRLRLEIELKRRYNDTNDSPRDDIHLLQHPIHVFQLQSIYSSLQSIYYNFNPSTAVTPQQVFT